MKTMHRNDGRRFRLSGWVACALALLASPAFADDEGGGGSGGGGSSSNSGSGGTVAGGDETIGTLPIVGGPNFRLPTVEGWRGDRPAFYLQGTATELSTVIVSARGSGFATLEVLDLDTELVRVAFHGDVSLVLDRISVETLPIHSGIAVPASYGPRRAMLTYGSGKIRTSGLRAGLLPLELGSLSTSEVLDRGPLEARTSGLYGRTTTDRIFATADVLVLRQTY